MMLLSNCVCFLVVLACPNLRSKRSVLHRQIVYPVNLLHRLHLFLNFSCLKVRKEVIYKNFVFYSPVSQLLRGGFQDILFVPGCCRNLLDGNDG